MPESGVKELTEQAGVSRVDTLEFIESQDLPQWFGDAQRAAWIDFQSTPAPSRKDEAWRFASVKSVDLSGFRSAGEVASEGRLVNQSVLLSKWSAKLVFGNNRLLLKDVSALPPGIEVVPLADAVHSHEGLLREYFMSQPVELGSHKYAALHRAMVTSGVVIHVADGVEVADPIEIFHWVEGENASVFPHTLIVCGANSKVTVIDRFCSADNCRALACGVNDLHVGPGANLTYIGLQEWSPSSLAFHVNSTVVDRDATATALTLNLGGRFVRGESLSRMIAPGARSVMLSINPAEGDREIDQRTLQDHAAPNATSDLLYHNSLDDRARTIFAGLIKVNEGAHGTDAYQKVRNLLLSDEAEANSMPGLEILADDVRCSHGATSGQINEDEIFYMKARGIPERVARRMILAGFFEVLTERIEHLATREAVADVVRSHLLTSASSSKSARGNAPSPDQLVGCDAV